MMVTDGAKRLPDGWEETTLREVLSTIESGGRPKGGARGISDGIPSLGGEHLLYSGKFNFDEIKYVPQEYYERMTRGKIKKNDVLVVKDGATTGKTSFVGDDFPFPEAAVNEHVFILRPKETVLHRFLFYWFQSPFGQKCVAENFRGAAQGGITLSILDNSIFPVAPLPEQERIVNRIEELFSDLEAGVAALERVRAGLKRYQASVLKAAVEGKLVSQDENDEPASELLSRILSKRKKKAFEPEAEDLPTLPNGWVWATADQLSESERSITYGVVKLGEETDDGIPTLRSSNVRHLLLETDVVKRISPSIASQYKRTKLEGGEILITVRGTLGGVVVAPEEVAGWNISREVAMIALVDKQIGRLLQYFIASVPLQNWLSRHTRGIAYTGINIETLKQLPIPLPPLEEQRRIVAEVERRLSVVREVESAVEAGLARAARLRQAILKHAFEGKL